MSGERGGSMAEVYRARRCPCCGSADVTPGVVRSTPRAEDQPFDDILRQWDTDLFTEKAFFSYGRCGACGLLYCPAYPDDAQLARLYGTMKPNMSEVPERCFRSTQRGYLRTLLRHAPPAGDVIEVGPDRGFLVHDMAARPEFGRFWFVEPNVVVHDELRAAVAPKPCDIAVDLNRFDHIPEGVAAAALMVHVLDHLTDPLHHLVELHRCLKKGGLVSIVVHNERSLLARLFGSRHPIYCPYHPQLFNPVTLAALLRKAGFDVVAVRRTVNHFPAGYLARNAAFRAGLGGRWIPDLRWAILPLPLGNIQAVARK
jgi:SAM-dependent methyltransferase